MTALRALCHLKNQPGTTRFPTPFSLFAFHFMAFGLKNAAQALQDRKEFSFLDDDGVMMAPVVCFRDFPPPGDMAAQREYISPRHAQRNRTRKPFPMVKGFHVPPQFPLQQQPGQQAPARPQLD